mmetsp:Transcript_40932/g.101755  ORF Transcript_40932/g.101755 Transcript_40932/m.101755 type:complete len:400 (+) Transcript_40932:1310-2509(+)
MSGEAREQHLHASSFNHQLAQERLRVEHRKHRAPRGDLHLRLLSERPERLHQDGHCARVGCREAIAFVGLEQLLQHDARVDLYFLVKRVLAHLLNHALRCEPRDERGALSSRRDLVCLVELRQRDVVEWVGVAHKHWRGPRPQLLLHLWQVDDDRAAVLPQVPHRLGGVNLVVQDPSEEGDGPELGAQDELLRRPVLRSHLQVHLLLARAFRHRDDDRELGLRLRPCEPFAAPFERRGRQHHLLGGRDLPDGVGFRWRRRRRAVVEPFRQVEASRLRELRLERLDDLLPLLERKLRQPHRAERVLQLQRVAAVLWLRRVREERVELREAERVWEGVLAGGGEGGAQLAAIFQFGFLGAAGDHRDGGGAEDQSGGSGVGCGGEQDLQGKEELGREGRGEG